MEGLSRVTRIKLIGLTVVVAAALSVVVVASASAAPLPELTKPGTTTELAAKGIKTKGVGNSILESASETKVTCTGNTGVGTGSGTKKVISVKITFTGCESSSLKCNTSGSGAGVILTNTLEGEIGYIGETSKKEVGFDLWPSSRTAMEKTLHEFNAIFVKFTCAGFLNDEVRGSVIGKMTPVNKSVKAAEHYTLTYEKEGVGVQKIRSLKGVEGGVVDVLESKLAGGAFEKATQEGTEEVSFGEDSELKA